MIKVSLIVPVYNMEKYLKKCLDSLINQTLDDIEIIIIDDNSSDSSPEIINYYYKNNPNKVIPIILNENQKVGYARNIGIERAKGEYILFVDSDDYVDNSICEITYNKTREYNYDIVCFDLVEVYDNHTKLKRLQYDSSINGKIDINKRRILFNSKGYFTTRLYKRELLVNNKIKFPEGIFFEDSTFNTLILLYAQSVAKIDKGLYYYLIRQGSSSCCKNEIRLYDRIDTLEFMMKEVSVRNLQNEFGEFISKKYLEMTVGNLHLCLESFDIPNKNKMRLISSNLKKNFENYSEIEQYKDLDKVSKLYLTLNEFSPSILIKVDLVYRKVLSKLIR